MAGCCKHGHKSSGYIKCEEFLDELRNYELLKEDRGPWSCLVSWLDRWVYRCMGGWVGRWVGSWVGR